MLRMNFFAWCKKSVVKQRTCFSHRQCCVLYAYSMKLNCIFYREKRYSFCVYVSALTAKVRLGKSKKRRKNMLFCYWSCVSEKKNSSNIESFSSFCFVTVTLHASLPKNVSVPNAVATRRSCKNLIRTICYLVCCLPFLCKYSLLYVIF